MNIKSKAVSNLIICFDFLFFIDLDIVFHTFRLFKNSGLTFCELANMRSLFTLAFAVSRHGACYSEHFLFLPARIYTHFLTL